MDNIKNKTVLITGGASGLGFTYAQKMLKNGAKVGLSRNSIGF